MTCVHRWRIEEPARETSLGVCRYCGATREFANSEEGVADRARPVNHGAPGGKPLRLRRVQGVVQ